MLSITIFTFSKLLLILELAAQLVVVVTESVSNSQFRRFPPSSAMMGYTGQSLLVIIVSILIMLMTLLVLRNLGRVLVQTSWKIAVSCIGFSLASIAFRTFSAWFVVSPSDMYYVPSYNITSYFIIVGALIWVPFIFCKSNKYVPDTTTMDADRYRIRSTRGERRLFTHRPHQDEDNRSITTNGVGESLPSYYEMIPPPSYKNLTPSPIVNGDNSNDLLPQSNDNNPNSTNDNINVTMNELEVSERSRSSTDESHIVRDIQDHNALTPSSNTNDSTVIDMSMNNIPTSLDESANQQATSQSNQIQSSTTNI